MKNPFGCFKWNAKCDSMKLQAIRSTDPETSFANIHVRSFLKRRTYDFGCQATARKINETSAF